MVTQHVRSVEVTYADLPPPAPPRTGDIIQVVGSYETAPTAPAVSGPYRSLASAQAISGTDGLVYDALQQIFSQGSAPDVYICGVATAAGDTVPSISQLNAALDVIQDTNIAVLYAPGATSGATGNSTAVDANATAIKTKCNELGCLAILDAPYGSAITNANRVLWGTNNLNGGRALGFGPSTNDDKPIGGYFLGAWDAAVAANGRGTAGSPHGRVIAGLTAAGLSDRIPRNPRVTSGTDEISMVNAGIAVAAVRGDGAVVVSMSDFPGIDTILRFWTVQLAMDHLSLVLEETLGRVRNLGPAVGRLEWISDQLQLAARPLQASGEVGVVRIAPDDEHNTPAVIAAGNPQWVAEVFPPVPIVGPSIRIAVGVPTA